MEMCSQLKERFVAKSVVNTGLSLDHSHCQDDKTSYPIIKHVQMSFPEFIWVTEQCVPLIPPTAVGIYKQQPQSGTPFKQFQTALQEFSNEFYLGTPYEFSPEVTEGFLSLKNDLMSDDGRTKILNAGNLSKLKEYVERMANEMLDKGNFKCIESVAKEFEKVTTAIDRLSHAAESGRATIQRLQTPSGAKRS